MRRVKLFKSLEFGFSELEEHINEWIEQNQIKVVDVKVQLAPQTASMAKPLGEGDQSDILVMVIYEK